MWENYVIAMIATGGIYALLTLGLNLVWGLTGMVNLGLVGFFAVGGYASALLTLRLGWPIAAGIAAAFALGAASGVAVTLATLRLRGDYLAIVTLGFAEVIRLIATNEVWLTNGSDGIARIPGPWRGVLSPSAFNLAFCAIVLACVALALWLAERVRASPFGRSLRAIREDDVVAAVAGKWVTGFKLRSFALGAGFMAVAGALYGHFNSYIAPDLFQPLLTIYIFLALSLGGTGNNYGAVAGAFAVIALLESTRFLLPLFAALQASQVAALREMTIGVLLIVVLRVRPGGLLPERLPRHRPPSHPQGETS
jgi:branched-chain amino acid transport system permease protein